MKFLIADDHQVLSNGLAMLLKSNYLNCVVTLSSSVADTIKLISESENHSYNFLLVDMTFPLDSGLSILKYIQSSTAKKCIKTLVISGISDVKIIGAAKTYGADGFVFKNDGPESIFSAINQINNGGTYFEPGDNALTEGSKLDHLLNLSSRQKDLLDLLLLGYSNKKIAGCLGLSYGTVKNYMFDLMRTLSVRSRMDIVILATDCCYVPRSIGDIRSNSLK